MKGYESLSREELEERLKLAEDVCVMYGWSGIREKSPRERATHELWRRWIQHVGNDSTDPQDHRDLDELEAEFERDAR